MTFIRAAVLIILIIVVFILIFVYTTFSGLRERGKSVPRNRPGTTGSGARNGGKTRGNGARNGRDPAGGTMFGKPADAFGKPGKALPCPLCGSVLAAGERVRSYVYRAGGDSLSHIFGCPHCDPGSRDIQGSVGPGETPARAARTCPVCRKTVPPDGYLVARMFERTEPGSVRKTHVHVHVLGCTGCRRAGRR